MNNYKFSGFIQVGINNNYVDINKIIKAYSRKQANLKLAFMLNQSLKMNIKELYKIINYSKTLHIKKI